jgi:DNA/RNA endonuclease G (NUC1)
MFRAVLARDDAGNWDAYAWLVPNTSKLPKEWKIADYQLTVDSLEKLVGWDFFSELSKPVQDKIEAELPH